MAGGPARKGAMQRLFFDWGALCLMRRRWYGSIRNQPLWILLNWAEARLKKNACASAEAGLVATREADKGAASDSSNAPPLKKKQEFGEYGIREWGIWYTGGGVKRFKKKATLSKADLSTADPSEGF